MKNSSIKKLVTRKTDGAEGVVVALVLIVVAVALSIVFRNSIGGILDNGLGQTNNAVSDLFDTEGLGGNP